ncbi:hypothetical protein KDW_20870 [Dictyobacter vulcani]|uniref:Oxygen sensor histidine kinase NreB n=1 Tax=Dictyobacter vulcani TaxID=2607529 RepID=A0A5J4KJE7_9CHLR|nr:hybrid sensor histidine kinase/response regulator transcription factor [Dictyobacter vulcani]GER87925.1 hypothetical protein KDW_20870 [Dictyobacter vulcani]
MGTADKPTNPSSPATHASTLPEVMYSLGSLTDLYEMGFVLGMKMDSDELRQHILTHMRRSIQATGACLLLYHAAQQHFIPVSSQGEKLPCGQLSTSLNGQEIERLSLRGPGATLDTREINHQTILLVTLNYHKTLIGLVALSLVDKNTLLDSRGLLLTYMGNVAGQILYTRQQWDDERQAAIEHERLRIARDLHDSVVQQITFTFYKLELIQRLLEQQKIQESNQEIIRARAILEESLQELRASIHALPPPLLEEQGIQDAIAQLLDQYAMDDPGTSIQQNITVLQPIPEQLEVPILRLLQEALANIRKHAHASIIQVQMHTQGNLLFITIQDNGKGISTQQPHVAEMAPEQESTSAQMGLKTMRTRVQEAGGSWKLHSQPGKGTSIKVYFPLAGPIAALTPREQEILPLIAEGLTNREIAKKLAISRETVKTHVHHMMQKLQVKERTQIALVAATQGWI